MFGGWSALIFPLLMAAIASSCLCPPANILTDFPSEVPVGVCCLNYSGSTLGVVPWSRLTNQSSLRILDLSRCNITSLEFSSVGASLLEKVYLAHNGIAALPRYFLAGQPRLKVVDLSWNMLEELPVGFLQDSDSLLHLDLRGNQLRSLPVSVLQRPVLSNLELDGNPWECSCSFLQILEVEELARNLTCAVPWTLAGRMARSAKLSDACRPASLTALFVALPILILATLLLCWCCGRKRKEAPVFRASKKRTSNSKGTKSRGNSDPMQKTADHLGEGILIPASKMLASTNEDEEVPLGSMESLHSRSEGRRLSRSEPDAISVTEVLKDSTDREKAYMTQSTEYYSLVPGIQLDDSDHDG
ncbi:leucine-rich repeat and transmembrane domain-containing protein 2 [Syngnathoides biaculeatus]|uniref:leucine-rich repeat and transmembrane domain-containing protein 2 n=1 Tax=Syngnathoides biaculeatus TaxID=300417 RepID=UPI002ADD8E5B|nr:leucine-rich repeat and transmembrane domain-containing protein 2 [Syngnathoides biaculeatus]XP_061696265.1 leucine-rich repeat and transmembrane domain-containing protein 2 [Syngnathoides biaculeatus]